MTIIEHENTDAEFQQLHAINVEQNSRICRAFAVDDRVNLYRHHTQGIVVDIVSGRLGQRAVAYIIDVTGKAIRIRNVIHPS